MKRFEKFLFFYSILAITVVFFSSAFFNPSPANFVSGVALLPLVAYFWIKMTSAEEVTASRWSIRFVTVVFLLASLGVFSSSLGQKNAQVKSQQEKKISTEEETKQKIEELTQEVRSLKSGELSSEELIAELTKIQDRLSTLGLATDGSQNQGFSDLFLDSETQGSGHVAIKSATHKVIDVLENPSFSSQKIGEMAYGETYSYSTTSGAWYFVELPGGAKGWVNEKDVTEASIP